MGGIRRVGIAVPTFRRPGGLRRLLPTLLAEAEGLHAATGDVVRVVVVDNNADASAGPIVEAWRSTLASQWSVTELRHHHEPAPGISAARNAALVAAEGCDLLAFIDDDGEPVPGWLCTLVGAHDRYGGSIVGRMSPVYPVTPSPWIRDGGFFERAHRPTGTRVLAAATNNLLLEMAAVRRHGLRFDDRLGTIGGEDTLFTRQLTSAGAELRWCDEAVVMDHVAEDRMRRDWVLRRRFRFGGIQVVVRRESATSTAGRVLAGPFELLRAAARAVRAVGRLAVAGTSGSLALRARAEADCWRSLGTAAAVVGLQFHEYAPAGAPTVRRWRPDVAADGGRRGSSRRTRTRTRRSPSR